MQMAGEPTEISDLGDEVEEGGQSDDDVDAKPDRRGRFLLFKRWFCDFCVQNIRGGSWTLHEKNHTILIHD